jgi:hypothetical protein
MYAHIAVETRIRPEPTSSDSQTLHLDSRMLEVFGRPYPGKPYEIKTGEPGAGIGVFVGAGSQG